jgi:hypothetical protein
LPPPEYPNICEPFAGSAGYSLRHHEHQVLLCENDPHLYTLWSWLIEEATEALVREIPTNVPVGTDIRTLGLSLGQATLLKTWQRTNNVGDCWTISPWGNKPGQWTENTRARVASEVGAVKHWEVWNDGLEALRYIGEQSFGHNAETVTLFVDPPYRWNYQYRQTPWTDENYADLKHLILAVPGQKIVCEAVCPKTGRVPDWLPFKPWAERVTSRRKVGQNHHSKELLCVL